MSQAQRGDEERAFLDAVLADAEGTRESERFLSQDPNAWREGLILLLGDSGSAMAEINAEIAAIAPGAKGGFRRKATLQEERAGLVHRKTRVEARLRLANKLVEERRAADHAQRMTTPRIVDLEEVSIAAVRAHLRMALAILRRLDPGGETDET